MTHYKSYSFRIYPTEEQARQIDTTIDCCRFIYNHMLERNIKAYKRRGEHLSTYDMNRLLPQMKQYLPWLTKADNRALKLTCASLTLAYKLFFNNHSKFPKFKSKRKARQSFITFERVYFRNQQLKIPKAGWMPTSEKREINEKICEVTIIRDHGKYFANLRCKCEKDIEQVAPTNCIGLDYKSDGLYTDSNGNCCDMPRFYRQSQGAISKEIRKLNRKVGSRKGETPSNNYYKQLTRLQKKTRHAANQRKDYLHKKSTEIANQYDLVAVETLDLEAIAGQYNLGKSTKDNGYGMFLHMLEYKLTERGKTFVKVDKFYPSSQLCSDCGYKNEEVKNMKLREWVCPECGSVHDRDVNAARNILKEGMRIAL